MLNQATLFFGVAFLVVYVNIPESWALNIKHTYSASPYSTEALVADRNDLAVDQDIL